MDDLLLLHTDNTVDLGDDDNENEEEETQPQPQQLTVSQSGESEGNESIDHIGKRIHFLKFSIFTNFFSDSADHHQEMQDETQSSVQDQESENESIGHGKRFIF